MKRLWLWFIAFALCGFILVAQAGQSTPLAQKPAPDKKAAPGVEAAQTISMLTGVAISPLLGVSAVGAWKYFDAPKEQRANLPWYAQPWFWLLGLGLVAAVAAKDVVGPAVPTVLKKPLDVAEAVENKISGLVAAGAFVPSAATFLSVAQDVTTSSAAWPMIAGIDGAAIINVLLLPFAVVAFLIVWLAGHAINMLILLSPFATVDAALKGFRTFILSTVCATSFVDPYVGAVWALIIVTISYFLAGWAFRLTVFGSLFITDYVTFKRTRFLPDDRANWMFLAREISGVPIRTFGKLSRNEAGELIFTYKPWLVLPQRTLTLPKGKYAVGRALVLPEFHLVDGDDTWAVLVMPPRCVTHEERLARIYGVEVVDVGVLKGAKALWSFVKRLFGVRPSPAV
jgi:MFS family permease